MPACCCYWLAFRSQAFQVTDQLVEMVKASKFEMDDQADASHLIVARGTMPEARKLMVEKKPVDRADREFFYNNVLPLTPSVQPLRGLSARRCCACSGRLQPAHRPAFEHAELVHSLCHAEGIECSPPRTGRVRQAESNRADRIGECKPTPNPDYSLTHRWAFCLTRVCLRPSSPHPTAKRRRYLPPQCA